MGKRVDAALSNGKKNARRSQNTGHHTRRPRSKEIADDLGRSEHHHPTEVAVFFGEPNKTFQIRISMAKGPIALAVIFCGACMTGCRVGAKNTLDRNYLYLAEKRGAVVRPDTEVLAVRPVENGYELEVEEGSTRETHRAPSCHLQWRRARHRIRCC
ncbi:MAG: hypothetical protein R3A47_05320 [Polyangiales bacterium]